PIHILTELVDAAVQRERKERERVDEDQTASPARRIVPGPFRHSRMAGNQCDTAAVGIHLNVPFVARLYVQSAYHDIICFEINKLNQEDTASLRLLFGQMYYFWTDATPEAAHPDRWRRSQCRRRPERCARRSMGGSDRHDGRAGDR